MLKERTTDFFILVKTAKAETITSPFNFGMKELCLVITFQRRLPQMAKSTKLHVNLKGILLEGFRYLVIVKTLELFPDNLVSISRFAVLSIW